MVFIIWTSTSAPRPFERKLAGAHGILLSQLVQRLLRRSYRLGVCTRTYLKRIPSLFAAVDVESNGKHVTLDGNKSPTILAVYLGRAQAHGQHSFLPI